jgi:uncharacterized protein
MNEEWYSLKNFADNLHVLLVNETKDLHGKCYERPPYAASWIRNYGNGRSFYTSMGQREDAWTCAQVQNLWRRNPVRVVDADANTMPNIERGALKANILPPK